MGGGSFWPIRSNMKYRGVRTSTPQMPATQNVILANFIGAPNRVHPFSEVVGLFITGSFALSALSHSPTLPRADALGYILTALRACVERQRVLPTIAAYS